MSATAKDLLQSASLVIATPGWWTQGAAARDDVGARVEIHSSSASCFCMTGAIDTARRSLMVSHEEYHKARRAVYTRLAELDPYNPPGIADFNDSIALSGEEVAQMLWEAQRYVKRS